jgi:FKBP-type peptidyl-prolyl cis-trans isomerase 2
MKEGDFAKIDYTGKIVENGEIFDLTDEKMAKEKGIFNPNIKYGPISIIIGANFVLKGLENAILDMKVGEKKKITLKPEDAFGERNAKLLKMIPASDFKDKNIALYPGMPINLGEVRGRIASVSGGRVKVDFNHPLAGKTLEYDVELKGMIIEKKDKIRAIIDFFIILDEKDMSIQLNEEYVEIKFENKEIPKSVKKMIADTTKKWVEEIKKVKFVEEF